MPSVTLVMEPKGRGCMVVGGGASMHTTPRSAMQGSPGGAGHSNVNVHPSSELLLNSQDKIFRLECREVVSFGHAGGAAAGGHSFSRCDMHVYWIVCAFHRCVWQLLCVPGHGHGLLLPALVTSSSVRGRTNIQMSPDVGDAWNCQPLPRRTGSAMTLLGA
jgi:hypothetical protein